MNKKLIISIITGLILTTVLIIGFIVTNKRITEFSEKIDGSRAAYSDEFSDIRNTLDLAEQNLMLLNQDSNTLRELLNLSFREYPDLESDEKRPEDIESSEIEENVLFFKSIDRILENNKTEEDLIIFSVFVQNDEFLESLKSRGLGTEQGISGFELILTGDHGREYTLSDSKGVMSISSVTGESTTVKTSEDILRFIDRNAQGILEMREGWEQAFNLLLDLKKDLAIKNLLESKDLLWGEALDSETSISLHVLDRKDSPLVFIIFKKATNSFELSGRFEGSAPIGVSESPSLTSLKKDVIEILQLYDPRSPGDIAEEESRNKLLTLRMDSGFIAYLESLDVQLSDEFREDHYYYYLDLTDSENERAGSMAVQKHNGDIYLMDRDDIVITSLKTLGMNEGIVIKKKIVIPDDFSSSLPIIFGEKDIAFVLIGANEANTDTMMVVHLNELTGKGTVITIPRDLYYKGRKINNYYPTFGPGELMRVLSEITGLPVKRYMFIDMFAFADVVDILGGIDVVLEDALIDPTYRTKENGIWSTLHYEAGPLHLGGIEALRVARSRHSSSDFGRAERQLMILMALKEKMISLNAGDAGKLFKLADSLINYVQTDFSVVELINLFTRFRNSPFSQHVLSWDNVLYNTYSNLYLLEEGIEVDEKFNKGAWILLPENNDWDVIKWYVRKVVSE